MSSNQEQITERFWNTIRDICGGTLNGGTNLDGTLRPFEMHFGGLLEDSSGNELANVFGSISNLPDAARQWIHQVKTGYRQAKERYKQDCPDDVFETDFNFYTFRLLPPWYATSMAQPPPTGPLDG